MIIKIIVLDNQTIRQPDNQTIRQYYAKQINNVK